MDKKDKSKDKAYKRRDFINNGVRLALGISVVGTAAFTLKRSRIMSGRSIHLNVHNVDDVPQNV